jgi:hypothetical protein
MMRDPDDKSNPILDSYMQLSSYKHEECPVFNLYEIDTSFLIPNKFEKTSDKRELTYSDIIPPETITLIRQYNTKEIENRFIENEEAKLPWHA